MEYPLYTLSRALAFCLLIPPLVGLPGVAFAQSAQGELQGRPAPVSLRRCTAGANQGALCNDAADCPGATCPTTNIFNLSVAVHFAATAAQIQSIEDLLTAGSQTLLDVTDGQAQLGTVTIHNDAFGTTQADLRIYPATNDTWWNANTGSWKNGGSAHVSINYINNPATQGGVIAHELSHLIFDPRDEYESRAVNCGAVTPGASCPDAATIAAGQASCLMDSNGNEFCWGQGDAANLTDVTGGNHDATNVTEQSRCRSNRSCWDQLVWSWPDVFTKPAAAPDAGTNGVAHKAVNFVVTNDTSRVVLVLDESGSMGLESPTRMDRLHVAARNFVELADNGAEVGILSFATDALPASGRTEIAVAALTANRTALTTAIDGLTPATRTNIGGALTRAKQLITDAGGVTANTYIVLMTDGLNNEPGSTAAATLQTALDDLQAAGIPVMVTCTGADLGLDSQCAEIAAATGGVYADSADAGRLPQSFVKLSQRIEGREGLGVRTVEEGKGGAYTVYVEGGSTSLTLVAQGQKGRLTLEAASPSGQVFQGTPMTEGVYLDVPSPEPGEWKVRVQGGSVSLSGWSRNPSVSVPLAARYPTVLPQREITLYAYPRALGGAVSTQDSLLVTVTRPDGTTDQMKLHDRGREDDAGDDLADDGIFTGTYRDTTQLGAYTFSLATTLEGWTSSGDRIKRGRDRIERAERVSEVSVAVNDPAKVDDRVDDPPATGGGKEQGGDTRPPTKPICECGQGDPRSAGVGVLVLAAAALLRRRTSRA